MIILLSCVLAACGGGGSAGENLSDHGDTGISTPVSTGSNTKPVASQVTILGSGDIGSTLAINSVFEDSDGDKEGNSIVSWTTPTIELQRGINKTFTIPSGTEGKTIYSWIHPVDEHGAEGLAVRSDNGIIVKGNTTVSSTTPYEDLLEHRSGYAKNVTGGAGGDVVTITSLDNAGYLALEAALESPDAKWIRFSSGLTGTMTIPDTPTGYFRMGPNKTLDGRGANITIEMPTSSAGRASIFEHHVSYGAAQSNFIIHNIKFDNVGVKLSDSAHSSEGIVGSHGTVLVSTNPGLIWIDHVTVSKVWDDPFYIVGSTGTTISYMQGNNQSKQAIIRGGNATYHHNIADHDGFVLSDWMGFDAGYVSGGAQTGIYRAPYAQANAKVHMYNNYLSGISSGGAIAGGAQIYGHGNMFGSPVIANRAPFVVNYRDSQQGHVYQFDNVKENTELFWVQNSVDYLEASAALQSAANVFTPSGYTYTAESVGTSYTSTEAVALKAKLTAQAGWSANPQW